MSLSITRTLVLLATACLMLSGCIKPLVGTPLGNTGAGQLPWADAASIPALKGRIKPLQYRTQATFTEIGVGATVSLIDTVTNITNASTISDENGSFQLGNLKITPGRTYYLEATKGLPVGGDPNRAGNPAARIRTIVQFVTGSGWTSLSGPAVTIDEGTTALSVILSLRSATVPRPDEAQLLGSLTIGTPDVFTPSGNVSLAEYDQVEDFVLAAIGTDNDPLAVITYDTASQNYYLAQKGIQVTGVSPVRGTIGSTVRIEGSSLSNTPVVRFNGTVAAAISVNSIQTVVLAQVPAGATSGPLTVQVGTLVYNGANFAVENWDGHNVFDRAGNLYVASYRDNAIWRFAPDGTATIAASSSVFNNPRGIVIDAWDNLYVTSYNGHKIFQVRPNGEIAEYASGGLNRPWGLAINPAGDLFVASYSGDQIFRIATGSALPITPTVYPTTGLSGPSRLAFDMAGYLYVSNWDNGTIARVAPDGTTETLAAGLSNPGGVALDSFGNVYVGAHGNHRVYKISPSGQMAVLGNTSDYEDSVAFHPDGTLYVAGYGYPYIARMDLTGRVLGYHSPGHLPYSLASDNTGNLYVTSGQGWGSRAGIVTKATWNAASGSYDPLRNLVTGLPNPSALAFDNNGDLLIGDWTGLLFRANPNTGAYSTYAAGLGAIGDLSVASDGTVYVASWGDHRVHQVQGGTRTKSWATYYNWGTIVKGPDGAYYISDHSYNQILRLANGTMSIYKSGFDFGNPMGIAFDSAGHMYVAGWNNDRIYKVEAGTKNVTTYKSGIDAPGAMAFDASDNLYVAENNANRVRMVATSSLALTTYVDMPTSVRALVRDDVTGDLYVGGYGDQTLYKVDGTTQAITALESLGGSIWNLSRDTTTGDLYAACYSNDSVVKVPAGGGSSSLVTTSLGSPTGVLRDGNKTIVCRWNGIGVYEFTDGSPTSRIIGSGFWNPSGIIVDKTDERYVYVADWNTGSLVKLDTVGDTWAVVADSVDWLRGRNVSKGMTWGSDNRLYVQNWGGGTYKLDMSQVNRLNGNGVTFYGGNTSTMGILGGIAFGPNGVLYGTSWDWMRGSSTVIVGLPPGGLGSGVAGIPVNVWPNWVSF